MSIFLRSGLGLQDSRSYVQGFLKYTSGYMKDLRKSRTRPDQTENGLKLGHNYSRNKKKTRYCRMGRRKCHAACSTPQRNLRGMDRRQRLLEGDCRCSSETRNGYCFCCPVHCEGRQSRECSCPVHCEGRQSRECSDLCNFYRKEQ